MRSLRNRWTMKILIRAPQKKDIPAIVQLIVELASTAGETSPVTPAYVGQYLASPSSGILLAEVNGKVVGLLSYSIRPDLYHAGNCCLVEELIVKAAWQHQEIGTALMEGLTARAADCKEISVGVMAENAEALKFYRRQGLEEEAILLERHLLVSTGSEA